MMWKSSWRKMKYLRYDHVFMVYEEVWMAMLSDSSFDM